MEYPAILESVSLAGLHLAFRQVFQGVFLIAPPLKISRDLPPSKLPKLPPPPNCLSIECQCRSSDWPWWGAARWRARMWWWRGSTWSSRSMQSCAKILHCKVKFFWWLPLLLRCAVVIFRQDGTVTSSHWLVALGRSYWAGGCLFLSVWASKTCHRQEYFTK